MKAMVAELVWRVWLVRAAWRVYWVEARHAWADTQSIDAMARRARFRMFLWAERAWRTHERGA